MEIKSCSAVLSHFSHVWLFAILWTVASQASLSMRFSKQEYWSGLPCPPPGDLLNPGIEPRSPTLQADSLLSEPSGKPIGNANQLYYCSYVCKQNYSEIIFISQISKDFQSLIAWFWRACRETNGLILSRFGCNQHSLHLGHLLISTEILDAQNLWPSSPTCRNLSFSQTHLYKLICVWGWSFFSLAIPWGLWDLIPWLGIETTPWAVKLILISHQ